MYTKKYGCCGAAVERTPTPQSKTAGRAREEGCYLRLAMGTEMDGEEEGALEGRDFSACLFEALLLLGSFVVFYKFAW